MTEQLNRTQLRTIHKRGAEPKYVKPSNKTILVPIDNYFILVDGGLHQLGGVTKRPKGEKRDRMIEQICNRPVQNNESEVE